MPREIPAGKPKPVFSLTRRYHGGGEGKLATATGGDTTRNPESMLLNCPVPAITSNFRAACSTPEISQISRATVKPVVELSTF